MNVRVAINRGVDKRFIKIEMMIDGRDVYKIVTRMLPRELRRDFEINDLRPKYGQGSDSTEGVFWDLVLRRKREKK